MAMPASRIDSISLALMLRPRPSSHMASSLKPSDWSISCMHRHRDFGAHTFEFRQRMSVLFLLGEDREIACRRSENGEAEGNEHGGDDDLGPLGRVTSAH